MAGRLPITRLIWHRELLFFFLILLLFLSLDPRVNSSAPQMDFSDQRTVKHMKCMLATEWAIAVS
jgi:hypothetical protein